MPGSWAATAGRGSRGCGIAPRLLKIFATPGGPGVGWVGFPARKATPLPEIRLYEALARRLPLSFRAKIMVVAFLGTHIPLLALLGYFLFAYAAGWQTALTILGVALVATLVGTGVTLVILAHMLRPVSLTAEAMNGYLARRELPRLPTQFRDEVGRLMADTVEALTQLDRTHEQLAFYDAATGLPNRDFVSGQIDQHGPAPRMVVLVLHLRGAESLKAGLGAAALDRTLRAASRRWPRGEAAWSVLGRNGAAGLVAAVCPGAEGGGDAATLARNMVKPLAEPVFLDGRRFDPVFDVGASTPATGSDGDTLIAQAEAALSIAARGDRDGPVFYSPDLQTRAADRLQLLQDLRQALAAQDLSVQYQPFVAADGTMTGAEALVRWQHSERGWVSPGTFIPLAESEGLIGDITRFVLTTAIHETAAWLADAPDAPFVLSVNLSAYDLQETGLAARISALLAASGLKPERLQLELTETAVLASPEAALEVLGELRELGLKVALDDFGTGYSSLAYLRRLPCDVVKIDRAFVQGIDADAENRVLCRAILSLAEAFGRSTVAEGVETDGERNSLVDLGVTRFQGFYFARPMGASALGRLRGLGHRENPVAPE